MTSSFNRIKETVVGDGLGLATQAELNGVNTQLTDKTPFLNNGKLVLPSSFPKLPFNIYKNKYGEFYSDATPYNQFDWSDATQIFIKYNGSALDDGLTISKNTTLSNFKTKFNSGAYGTQKKFVLNLLDYVYISNGNNGITLDIDADILIRSKSAGRFTWIGRVKMPLTNWETSAWVSNSGVFKTTQTTSHDVLDVVNLTVLDGFKMPSIYKKVTSLTACQAEKGTFYRSDFDCYCNPLDGHDINDIILVVSTAVTSPNQTFARTLMFENCGFLPSSYQTGTIDNINAKLYMFGCKFHRATNNGMYVSGQYKAHNFNCVVSHPTLDAFNYHTTNINSLATEVNCIGYGSGKFKMTTGQPTHSNNGSTAHDGMNVLRVGSRYYDCEGPIVADVDNCYSISIGCEASSILDTATGEKAAYYFYDRAEDTPETSKPKYVIECKGFGKNVDYGVKGTSKTYVANFVGKQELYGDIKGREALVW